ncbi:MAG: 7-carboxy-7-deazaguanine synthase [Candidatus Woesearchaeota archaeon]|nr:7-carboxy-7-deazaguanine synthase [Candidatus Woesearchaeota archaeon]
MAVLDKYNLIVEKKQKPKFRSANLNKLITKTQKILKSCTLCERKCQINRLDNEKGYCKVGNHQVVTSYFTHFGEEPFFVPSFTIFFWSCTLACQFCQNWTISQRVEKAVIYKPKHLAENIDKNSHCKNINFVGGEPTPYIPFILQTLSHVSSNLPIIWNSNFYMSEQTMGILKSFVDVYLSDWKFWSNKCAKRLCGVENYQEIIKRNHLIAAKQTDLVIRHLMLPNHFECCTKPILEFISNNLKNKAILNLMDQYRPEYRASEHEDINQRLSKEEFQKAKNLASDLNINFIT